MYLSGWRQLTVSVVGRRSAAAVKLHQPPANESTGTFVLRRENPPALTKRDRPEGEYRPLMRRNMIYETLDWPGKEKLPNIDVILTQYVEDLGRPGDVVSVKMTRAQHQLLSRGKAVYASPENMEKYKDLAASQTEDQVQHSSLYSAKTEKALARQILAVTMNLESSWTVEPWHIRVAFRKAGFVVPEHCIEMPMTPISGPDVNRLENREFLVTVTINNCERVPVRCRLHHYATDPRDRLPYVPYHWSQPAEPLFPEEAKTLEQLPPPTNLPDPESDSEL